MVQKRYAKKKRSAPGRTRKVNYQVRPEDQARIDYLLDVYMSSSESQVTRLAIKNFADDCKQSGRRGVKRQKRSRCVRRDHSWFRKTVHLMPKDFQRIGAIQTAAGIPSSSEAIRSAIRWEAQRHAADESNERRS